MRRVDASTSNWAEGRDDEPCVEQQAARVNVDDATWRRFRILALEDDRSIADYLGQLVRDELRRAQRRGRSEGATAARDEPEPHEGGTAEVSPAGDRGADEPTDRVRLANVDVLTSLPRPAGPTRR